MTLDESVHGMRLRVIERAQVQGNVSAVCRELGISRTVFYRWRNRLERYGVDAERVIDLGFGAFLTKPVDPFNLARTVASLVGR
ncbi:MAG TPA: helix-turn-helix domain-containing protein [Gemmatimonadales bacterium]|nr:helix-turn-helix domain-containing protein [Gemmatimonadales bacterium]